MATEEREQKSVWLAQRHVCTLICLDVFTPLWNGVLSGANQPSSRQNPSVPTPPGHLTFSNRTASTFCFLLALSSSLATLPRRRHEWLWRMRRIHPSLSLRPSLPSLPSPPAFTHHDKLKMEEMCFSWLAFSGCCLNNRVARSTKLNSTSPWKDFLRRGLLSTTKAIQQLGKPLSSSPQRPKVNATCLTANQIAPGHTERVRVYAHVRMHAQYAHVHPKGYA